MLVEKLKKDFQLNKPILTSDILNIMKGYSRSYIYQLIDKEEKNGKLIRFDTGIYYIPKETEFGQAMPSVNSVVDKKYISNKGEIYGIYGKYVIDLNFLASSQVPNTIEVITNKETRRVREIYIKGRRVVLRKSRCKITNDNHTAYTLVEFFNNVDMIQYNEDKNIRRMVKEYINENNIKRDTVISVAEAFPSKAIKNLALSGVLHEIR